MKFEQRNKRPIYFYSNSIDEVCGLKNYGLLCKKKKNLAVAEAGLLCSRLEEILSLLYYTHTSFAFNSCLTLTAKIFKKSEKFGDFITLFSQGIQVLNNNRGQYMLSWSKATEAKSKRNRARSSLRLKSILKLALHNRASSEQLIIECAKKIAANYKKHCGERDEVLDDEVRECAGRKKKGFLANIIYNVSPEIKNYALGAIEIPAAHLGFAKFCFPVDNLPETEGSIYFDTRNEKLILETSKLAREENGCLLGDISSIVLNELQKEVLQVNFGLESMEEKSNKELGIGIILLIQ